MAWFEALQRFGQHPMIGEGYGIPFVFDIDSADARPHNTYLTILYKMGLVGFLPLAILVGMLHWKGWVAVRSFAQSQESTVLYIILTSQLVMCLFGSLNLLLESPFLASIFWLLMGVGIRAIYLLRHSACSV